MQGPTYPGKAMGTRKKADLREGKGETQKPLPDTEGGLCRQGLGRPPGRADATQVPQESAV